jgi:hypothetical protein
MVLQVSYCELKKLNFTENYMPNAAGSKFCELKIYVLRKARSDIGAEKIHFIPRYPFLSEVVSPASFSFGK